MEYLIEAIGYLAASIKYATLIFIAIYFLKIRKICRDSLELVVYYIFTLYFFMVLNITRVISSYGWHFNIGTFTGFSLTELFSLEKILNVLLFLPLGVFLPVVLKRHKWYFYLVGSFLISLFIEFVQCFWVGRLADITDIFANTLGAAIGLLLFCWLRRIYITHYSHRQIGIGSCTLPLNLVIFVFSIPLFINKLCLADILISNLFSYKLTWSTSNVYFADFSGCHYTIIYLIMFALLSFCLSKGHPEHLFSKTGKITALVLVVYLLVLLVYQWK